MDFNSQKPIKKSKFLNFELSYKSYGVFSFCFFNILLKLLIIVQLLDYGHNGPD